VRSASEDEGRNSIGGNNSLSLHGWCDVKQPQKSKNQKKNKQMEQESRRGIIKEGGELERGRGAPFSDLLKLTH
jgi:hypothetical protein